MKKSKEYREWIKYIEVLLATEPFYISSNRSDKDLELYLGVSEKDVYKFSYKVNGKIQLDIITTEGKEVYESTEVMDLYKKHVSSRLEKYYKELYDMSKKEFLAYITNKFEILSPVSKVESQFKWELKESGGETAIILGEIKLEKEYTVLTVSYSVKEKSKVTKKVYFSTKGEIFKSIHALNSCYIHNSSMSRFNARNWFEFVDTKWENGKRVHSQHR